MVINPVHNVGHDDHLSSAMDQHANNDPVLELFNVTMEDIPEGLLDSVDGNTFYSQERPIQSFENDRHTSPNGKLKFKKISISTTFIQSINYSDKVTINNCVAFGELTGPNELLQSQSETTFDLSAFGISSEASTGENVPKMGKIVEKIRRDVKQLGLLCAATDKEKLINILIINQQLNVIDPPPIEEPVLPEESRTIKSILKAPTMPQRINRKRNMNLKVSYGVVTAKEVVQSIMDREAADHQHEIEREGDDVAKLARENEIASVDHELKLMRQTSSTIRSEVAALNKEMIRMKKNKASPRDLKVQHASKQEKEVLLNEHDEQLRGLREKLRNLKAIHIETNRVVSAKRKTFELQKKQIGNTVQPSVTPPEVDEMELDSVL